MSARAAALYDALTPARKRDALDAYRRAVLMQARAFDALSDLEAALGADCNGLNEDIGYAAHNIDRGATTLDARRDIDAWMLRDTLAGEDITIDEEHEAER